MLKVVTAILLLIAAQPEPQTEAESPISSQAQAIYRHCDNIFTKYVDKQGNVDYKNLRRKRADLIPALRAIEDLHPAELMSWSQHEKIAFWLNAYNIFTLKVIIDNYPIEPRWFLIIFPDNSIMHIPGAWNKKYFKVMGLEYTLREIERDRLMDRYNDPRICMALSYASMSSAFIRNQAYRPEKIDEQLRQQTEKFLTSPRGITIDRQENIVHLSDIFNWYKESVIKKFGSVKKFRDRDLKIRAYLNFIIDYVSEDDAKFLESQDYTIKFQRYDWNLNEQPKK